METFRQVKQTVMDMAKEAREAVVDVAKEAKDKVMAIVDKAKESPQLSKQDALALLKEDHQIVAGFFDRLQAEAKGAPQLREGLFAQLKYELETHATVEEKLFYPRLEKIKEVHDLVRESYQEHALVKQLLSELANMPMEDPDWNAKLSVLKENVQQHVEEEENELFKLARKELGEAQLEELGVRIEQEKQALAAGNQAETRQQQTRQSEQSGQSSRSQAQQSSQSQERVWQTERGSRSAENEKTTQSGSQKRQSRHA